MHCRLMGSPAVSIFMHHMMQSIRIVYRIFWVMNFASDSIMGSVVLKNFFMHHTTLHVVTESALVALWDQVLSTAAMSLMDSTLIPSRALREVPCRKSFSSELQMDTRDFHFTINFNTKSRMTACTLKFNSQMIGPSQTITKLYRPHFLLPIYVYLVTRRKNYTSNTLHLQVRSMIITSYWKCQPLWKQLHTITSLLLECSLRLATACWSGEPGICYTSGWGVSSRGRKMGREILLRESMITMQVGECQIMFWNAASSSSSFVGIWILGIMVSSQGRNHMNAAAIVPVCHQWYTTTYGYWRYSYPD